MSVELGDVAAASGNSQPLADLGEKIGGARKDLASRRSDLASSSFKKARDDRPSWAKRYVSMQGVDGVWSILDTRTRRAASRGFATQELADAAIPIYALSSNHRAVMESDPAVPDSVHYVIYRQNSQSLRVRVVSESFPTERAALEYMATHAAEILSINTTFGESDLPLPQEYVRVGPQWRAPGEHVSGEHFMSVFGFRGVEFGNWNNQAERQAFMDVAFDGLMDLSQVLGIDPGGISLGGQLALAFGARGAGLSSARAHYEADYCVMNLTKMKGSGALAHEWFHALDHFLSRQLGFSPCEMAEQGDGTKKFVLTHPGQVFMASGAPLMALIGKGNAKAAVAASAKNFFSCLVRKQVTNEVDVEKHARILDGAIGDLQQALAGLDRDLCSELTWKKRHNKPASSGQMQEVKHAGDAMVNILTEMRNMLTGAPGLRDAINAQRRRTGLELFNADEGIGTSHLMGHLRQECSTHMRAIEAVLKPVRGTTGYLDTQRGHLDRVLSAINAFARLSGVLLSADGGKTLREFVSTDFLVAAHGIDRGRGEPYWAVPTEMAARSFMAIIRDEMGERGQSNTFLNYAPDGLGILAPWGVFQVFPRGQELQAARQAWGQLRDAILHAGMLPQAQGFEMLDCELSEQICSSM